MAIYSSYEMLHKVNIPDPPIKCQTLNDYKFPHK